MHSLTSQLPITSLNPTSSLPIQSIKPESEINCAAIENLTKTFNRAVREIEACNLKTERFNSDKKKPISTETLAKRLNPIQLCRTQITEKMDRLKKSILTVLNFNLIDPRPFNPRKMRKNNLTFLRIASHCKNAINKLNGAMSTLIKRHAYLTLVRADTSNESGASTDGQTNHLNPKVQPKVTHSNFMADEKLQKERPLLHGSPKISKKNQSPLITQPANEAAKKEACSKKTLMTLISSFSLVGLFIAIFSILTIYILKRTHSNKENCETLDQEKDLSQSLLPPPQSPLLRKPIHQSIDYMIQNLCREPHAHVYEEIPSLSVYQNVPPIPNPYQMPRIIAPQKTERSTRMYQNAKETFCLSKSEKEIQTGQAVSNPTYFDTNCSTPF